MRQADFSLCDYRSETLSGKLIHTFFNNLQAIENRRLFFSKKPPVFGRLESLSFCQFYQ
jgi:hypothetical protein